MQKEKKNTFIHGQLFLTRLLTWIHTFVHAVATSLSGDPCIIFYMGFNGQTLLSYENLTFY